MEIKKIFPSWRYHKELGGKIVKTAIEEQALGSDWHLSPANFNDRQPDPPVDEIEGFELEEKPKKKSKVK